MYVNGNGTVLQIPRFVSRSNADVMRKLADLKELSVYWDIDAKTVGHLNGPELQVSLQ